MTYLGLDLGTSGLKAILIDADQNILASATASLNVSRPNESWSEQAPADWIAACEQTIGAIAKKVPEKLARLRGIGLSGHMHGATLLDGSDQPLRPCILWNDTRAHIEAAEMDADPDFRETSGNIVFPGFTAPKLAWVQKHEPEIFAKTAKILLPKDYLRLWLTGELVSEMSDAAGTSWFDTAKRDWSDALLAKTNLSREHMPDLVEGSEVSGHLRGELASKWGVKESVVVAGGGGDNAASAVGVGVVKKGQAFLSLGTSGVLFAANDGYQPDAGSAVHTFCHALPNTWHQMGVILSATDALNWYSKIAGKSAAGLTSALGKGLRAPSKALFLPYLGGERTPYNDAHIRGAFTGLEHATDQDALTQAVIEGVAYAFKDCQNALAGTGTKIENLIAIGGGSLSRYWLELCATVLDQTIQIPEDGDFGGSFGAARLGLIAAENLDPIAICTTPKIIDEIQPNASLQDVFSESYASYRQTYVNLKSTM